jgi:mannosyltransferase
MTPDLLSYSNRHFTRQQRWQLIGLITLAFLLRFYRLNTQSMWFDETLSALFAWLPLGTAIQAMLQEGLHHSPLFYVLLHPFAAGDFNEFCLRFLLATLGVLSVPPIVQVGRMIVGARIGSLAAVLLVVSPFHVWYSQETRMYTLLIVSALGAMAFFVQARGKGISLHPGRSLRIGLHNDADSE